MVLSKLTNWNPASCGCLPNAAIFTEAVEVLKTGEQASRNAANASTTGRIERPENFCRCASKEVGPITDNLKSRYASGSKTRQLIFPQMWHYPCSPRGSSQSVHAWKGKLLTLPCVPSRFFGFSQNTFRYISTMIWSQTRHFSIRSLSVICFNISDAWIAPLGNSDGDYDAKWHWMALLCSKWKLSKIKIVILTPDDFT